MNFVEEVVHPATTITIINITFFIFQLQHLDTTDAKLFAPQASNFTVVLAYI